MTARGRWTVLTCLAGTALCAAGPPSGVVLDVIEGRVASLDEARAEGGLAVLAVRLEGSPTQFLLGPAGALEEAGLVVRVGDRVRLRYAAEAEGSAPVLKVLNVTRSRMLRLRTLRREPLWDERGQWRGGPHGPGRGPGPHGQGGAQRR